MRSATVRQAALPEVREGEEAGADLAVRIARVAEAVVVVLTGRLEDRHDPMLGHLLDDIVVGQGNLSVAVDLLGVLPGRSPRVASFGRAGRALAERRGWFRLVDPPDPLRGDLMAAGLGGSLVFTARVGAGRRTGRSPRAEEHLSRVLNMAAHPSSGEAKAG